MPKASAQETPASPPTAAPPVVSEATLARIRAALASEPAVTLDEDALRFYVQITAKPLTFADYLKGSGGWFEVTPTAVPTRLPGGARLPPAGGIDLLSLFRRANRAVQDRKVRQIRERIDQELEALDGANTTTGSPP
ncbi:MAG: hypothetical protein IT183_12365 [Acidobacteria bacterium]|nr:hypothetical protein [Acidobacteriota bacterium]